MRKQKKTGHLSTIASDRGHDEVVLALLMAGAEIEPKNKRRPESSLHLATYNGHTEIVLILLDAGAKVNVQDISGLTPLHFAAFWAYVEILTSLLDAGAELLEDYKGETPIDKAMSQSQTEAEELLRSLLSYQHSVKVYRLLNNTIK
jgi:ankyrin repeat protein